MPNFSRNIPERADRWALPIRRTPTSGRLQAIVTSQDLLGCDTHFYGGHTVPCEKPECKPCTEGIPFRWHAYVGALDQRTKLHFIFEVTAQAARSFIEYRDAHGTLRGCLFEACRLHARPNGRVILQTKPAPVEHIRLPSEPDLIRCLQVIWQLPQGTVGVEGQLFEMPRIATYDEPQAGNGQNRTRKPLSHDQVNP
jgi:hypothetical protein